MSQEILEQLAGGLARGELVPYLGPGALADVVDPATGEPIPADSEHMILAMNNGRPMSARLMWEFSRAAMNVELKRGRGAVNRFLVRTYGERTWTRAPLHDWLAGIHPPYVIDINRDTQLQDSYRATPHTLVRGIARIGGTPYRFLIHEWDGETYREVPQEGVDRRLPVLFKPLGSPVPDPTFIASDADFVDYITELMGGFAIPSFLKDYRIGRQYVLLGLRLTRDTERMILSNLIYAAGRPAGWALIAEPTAKERRFCARQGIEIVEAGIPALLAAAATRDGQIEAPA
ncbi:SIR2 family protein [Thiococcus pfennigii]|uniref:SIR2 family protein n=1 Tax=Thiococcus pfennigii TaxID=1057 RepID=UPI001904E2E2|nr:SIR2 family protein [Thiococcus pfennigii]MBK1701646.1 SIR2 family protein [Thiococcus pfennigii]